MSIKTISAFALVIMVLVPITPSFAQSGCGYFGTAPCPPQTPQTPQPVYQPQQPQCHSVFIPGQGWTEVCH